MGNKRKITLEPLDSQQIGTVRVVLDEAAEPPCCPHGPTILFKRESRDGTVSKCFYACAAHRDRKGCDFFMWQNFKASQDKKQEWKNQVSKNFSMLPTFEDIVPKGTTCDEFYYCDTCSRLIKAEGLKNQHAGHTLTPKLFSADLANPTKILTTLVASKKEAQFYFSEQSIKTIVENLSKNNFTRVLCIGTPKIHEKIRESYADKMDSLLMDFDSRLSQFFSQNEFCYYNMFNHFFFGAKSNKQTYLKFLKKSKLGRLVIVTDPPFGGRCELVANTYKNIQKDFADAHDNVEAEKCRVEIVWIFPYFMEHPIKSAVPEMAMSDYKVAYESDSGYRHGKEGGTRKQGSPVRIFTTIKLSKIDLSFEDGYKFCKKCNVWVSDLNRHCDKCGFCTAKNGGEYTHCDVCNRCVKSSWQHCLECNRCCLIDHRCNQGKVTMETVGIDANAVFVPVKRVKNPQNKSTQDFVKSRQNFAKNRQAFTKNREKINKNRDKIKNKRIKQRIQQKSSA